MDAKQDLRQWRTTRKRLAMKHGRRLGLSKPALKTVAHLIQSRDAMDGSGMFPSPSRIARELHCCAKTVRNHLGEATDKGLLVRRYRKRLPGGEIIFVDASGLPGGRDTTPAFWLNPELGIEPGYFHPEGSFHPEAEAESFPPQVSTPGFHPRSSVERRKEASLPKEDSSVEESVAATAKTEVLSPEGVRESPTSPFASYTSYEVPLKESSGNVYTEPTVASTALTPDRRLQPFGQEWRACVRRLTGLTLPELLAAASPTA